MKYVAWRFSLLAAAFACPVIAQTSVGSADLVGWWAADPVHGGESSHVALQFLEKEGKLEARMSIPAIAVFDVSLGEVTIAGEAIDTTGLSQPLTWSPSMQTLSGFLSAEAVPVYKIPVEFRRAAPFEKPPARDWNAPRPKVVWTIATGAAVWAGIERDADGTLFVGNEQGDLHAIDKTGKARWKFATHKPIRGQPTAIGAHVYVASDSGFLYKLDRKSGVEVWRARVDAGSEPRIPPNEAKTRWDRYGSSVVADAQRLYYASRDKNLYAIDIRTGRVRWRFAAGDIMTATPALYKESVILAAFDGKVQAVSARDGKPRWTYDAKLAVAGDVVVAGDRVLLGSRSYDLIALDAATGKELWKRYYWFSWIESPPVVRDGVVYTGSSDATNVYAIDLSDGSLRWKTAVPGWSWQRTAVSEESVVAGTAGTGEYPGRRAGSLVALDRGTGAIRWMYLDPPSKEVVEAKKVWGFGAAPVIADGVVYAADLGGKVHAVELTTSASAAAPPAPCASLEHRQFDFWLGDWQVHNPAGAFSGFNRITSEYRGCVLHERYATGRGYSGESLNVYDPARKVWHQTWVDDTGLLLTLEGEWNGDSMILEGLAPGTDGAMAKQRITWTPNAGGSVRQLWETADAKGAWTVAFDGRYTKK